MTENKGKVVSINGNLVSVEFDGNVSMNEICYVLVDNTKLKSEVIRIRGNIAQIQVYEMTDGIKCGDDVEFAGDMLSADLGPGLLGQIYDGLQNPLPILAEQAGWFLERGIYAELKYLTRLSSQEKLKRREETKIEGQNITEKKLD